jgi:hypothetical protein
MQRSFRRSWLYECIALLFLLIATFLLPQWGYDLSRSATFTATAPPVLLPRAGFSIPEQFPDRAGSYRWTTGAGQLALPNPGGATRLHLTLAGGPGRTVPVQLRTDRFNQEVLVAPEPRVYTLLLPPTRAERQMLYLNAPTIPERDSDRVLGVVVGDITVTGGGGVPTRVWLALLSATVGAYGFLRVVGQRRLVAALVVIGMQLPVVLIQTYWGWQYTFFAPTLLIILAVAWGGWLMGQFPVRLGQSPTAIFPLPAWLQQRWRGVRLVDWGAAGIILSITYIYFQPYLFTGKTIIPYDLLHSLPPWNSVEQSAVQNQMMGDVITAHAPWRYLYRAAYRSGEIPFWNPYSYGGMPFLAYHQTGVLYPPNLIFVLVSVETGFTLYLMFHLYISGLGMYALLRRLALQPPAALIGALTWMLCGMLTVWMAWLSSSVSIMWLPVIVLAADWVLASGTWRSVGGLALVIWLALLGGHPQYTYYNMVTLGVFLLWRSLSLDLTWRQRGVRLAQFTAGGLLGLMIAAVQLVPLVELQQHNSRTSISIAEMMAGAIPLRHIVTLLVPEFYGGPNWYYGAGNFVEFTGYIGVTSLIIGVLALLYPTLQRQSALLFFTGLTLVALHLAYGGVLNVILSLPPGYTAFRGLQRIQGVWSFGAAGMVAWGVQALLLAHGWRRQLIGSMAAGLIALGLWIVHDTEVVVNLMAWLVHSPRAIRTPPLIAPFRQTAWLVVGMGGALALILWLQRYHGNIVLIAPVVLFLLIGVDLLQFNRRYLPVVDAELAYPTTPGLDYLVAHREEGRIARFKQGYLDAPLPVNTNIVYGLEDLQGYGSFTLDRYNQIIRLIEPEKYNEIRFINRLSNFQSINTLETPLLDLLGVRFLLVDAALLNADEVNTFSQSLEKWEQVYSGTDVTIYRNRQALPPAWIVGDVQMQPDDAAQLAVLSNPTFNPAQQAVVAQAAEQPFDPNATGTVQVVRRSLNTLELDVHVDARPGYAALLLVRQNYYPGWKVRVDGTHVPLLRADVNLQGIPLAAGSHRVVLTFMPSYFRALFALALIGLVCSVALLLQNPFHRPSATVSRSLRA